MKTNTRPPKEIYDILHAAEAKGIDLPESVEKWFELETAINEDTRCGSCRLKNGNIACDSANCSVFNDLVLLVDTFSD